MLTKKKKKMAHKWAQINLLFKQHDAVCENENTCVAPGATLCRVYDRALWFRILRYIQSMIEIFYNIIKVLTVISDDLNA